MFTRTKPLLPYFAAVLAITLPWFFKSGYLFFVDFVLGPNVFLDWQSISFLRNAAFFLLSYVFSVSLLEKVFISLVLLAVLLGGKKFVEEVLLLANKEPNQWLVFLLSLFALFNPFVYDRVMFGQFGMALSLGFLMLFLGNLLSYFRTEKLKYVIWLSVFGGLMALFSPHFIFFLAPFFILLIAHGIIERGMNFKKIAWLLAFVMLIALLINLNWLAGLLNPESRLRAFINGGISNQDLVAFKTAGKTGEEAAVDVLAMSGFWGKNQSRYTNLATSEENWKRSFFFLLPIILLGLWAGFREKKTRFLSAGILAIFIIACTLAIGVRLPASSSITQFLYDYIPFYKGLRESQKWVSAIVVIYLFCLAMGTGYLLTKKTVRHYKLLGGLTLSGIIILQAPLLLFGFNNQIKPVDYPQDWHEVNNYFIDNARASKTGITRGKCDENILFLPWHLYIKFNWIGRVVMNPANMFFACPTISGTNMEGGGIYDNSMSKEGKLVAEWLKAKGNTSLFEELKIRHLILAKEADWRDYSWIENLPNVKLIKETSSLKLYQVSFP